MTPMDVQDARELAERVHADQTDKLGEPYLDHLEAVHAGVLVLGGGEDEQIVAWLHDALEDGKLSLLDLRDAGATAEQISLLIALTHLDGQTYDGYITQVCAAGPQAIRVKVADLLHNTRHDRLQALIDAGQVQTVGRLLTKYRPALARLLTALGLLPV